MLKINLMQPVDADVVIFFRKISKSFMVIIRMIDGDVVTRNCIFIPYIANAFTVNACLSFQTFKVKRDKHCLPRFDKSAQLFGAVPLILQVKIEHLIAHALPFISHLYGKVGKRFHTANQQNNSFHKYIKAVSCPEYRHSFIFSNITVFSPDALVLSHVSSRSAVLSQTP